MGERMLSGNDVSQIVNKSSSLLGAQVKTIDIILDLPLSLTFHNWLISKLCRIYFQNISITYHFYLSNTTTLAQAKIISHPFSLFCS